MTMGQIRSSTLQLTPVDSIVPTAQVRHIDQLDTEAFDRFYRIVEADTDRLDCSTEGFTDGEVIVFTQNYRVSIA